jgi:hypothetical protein
MNSKICKLLRTVVFANNPSSVERKNRKWAIYEDKKQNRILRCLDPRAIYKTMKEAFKLASPLEKIQLRKDIKADAKRIKKEFSSGPGKISGTPSFLGHNISVEKVG